MHREVVIGDYVKAKLTIASIIMINTIIFLVSSFSERKNTPYAVVITTCIFVRAETYHAFGERVRA